METIPKADCQKVGFFRKTHGIHGEVVLEFEQHFELSVENADRFFVELEGLLVPFFVLEDGLRFKSTTSAIVAFDGVKTDAYAKRLVGNLAYLFNEEIVPGDDEPIDSLLVGFLIFDENSKEIGRVERVDDYSGNKVITTTFNNDELLIPFNEDLLLDLDEEQKTIRLAFPEGLLE